MKPVTLHQDAEADLREALDYYAGQEPAWMASSAASSRWG